MSGENVRAERRQKPDSRLCTAAALLALCAVLVLFLALVQALIGDRVRAGQPLTRGIDGGVCVHASVSGRVTAVEERPHPWGDASLAVVLENDG